MMCTYILLIEIACLIAKGRIMSPGAFSPLGHKPIVTKNQQCVYRSGSGFRYVLGHGTSCSEGMTLAA